MAAGRYGSWTADDGSVYRSPEVVVHLTVGILRGVLFSVLRGIQVLALVRVLIVVSVDEKLAVHLRPRLGVQLGVSGGFGQT